MTTPEAYAAIPIPPGRMGRSPIVPEAYAAIPDTAQGLMAGDPLGRRPSGRLLLGTGPLAAAWFVKGQTLVA